MSIVSFVSIKYCYIWKKKYELLSIDYIFFIMTLAKINHLSIRMS